MAVPANAFDQYEAVGNREDLSDMIFDVSPEETPILSAIKKTKATNTLHQWQTDELGAGKANAQVEGDDATGTAVTPTVKLNNYTQILEETVIVTGTQESGMNPAGRNSEMAYQTARKMKTTRWIHA